MPPAPCPPHPASGPSLHPAHIPAARLPALLSPTGHHHNSCCRLLKPSFTWLRGKKRGVYWQLEEMARVCPGTQLDQETPALRPGTRPGCCPRGQPFPHPAFHTGTPGRHDQRGAQACSLWPQEELGLEERRPPGHWMESRSQQPCHHTLRVEAAGGSHREGWAGRAHRILGVHPVSRHQSVPE